MIRIYGNSDDQVYVEDGMPRFRRLLAILLRVAAARVEPRYPRDVELRVLRVVAAGDRDLLGLNFKDFIIVLYSLEGRGLVGRDYLGAFHVTAAGKAAMGAT